MLSLAKKIVAWVIIGPIGLFYLLAVSLYLIIGYILLWAFVTTNVPREFYID